MADVQPCPDLKQLQRLLDGLLPEQDQAELNAHLGQCPSCQRRLDELIAGPAFWSDIARHLQSAHAAIEAGTATRYCARAGDLGDQADDDLTLEFLQPSERPESLGRLAHYEVLEVIGRGGMGIVLRAFDEKLHRVVAIKVIAPRLAATSPPRKRFLREARAAAQVRHEYVVDIHAVEEQPIPHLVMEYVPGESLQQRLNRIGPLDVPEVLHIGQQIARGLAAAHAQGLIHRDVKPGNILLENGIERVKITDFGMARAVDDASLTQSGIIAGTPLYMAPEQAQGTAIDHRADLFSLGSVLYTMCSGRPPFRAPTSLAVLKRVVEDTPRPIQEIIPEVPAWLCDVITRLHAKRPEERYQSAAEVADVLGQRLADVDDAPGAKLDLPFSVSPSQVSKPSQSANRAPGTGASGSSAIAWRPRLFAASALLVLLCVLSLSEATGVTQFTATVIRLLTPEAPPVQAVAKAEPGAFVVLAAGNESKFDTLADAVLAASDGDTIEIRGNGPFVTSPITSGNLGLTLKAAAGFRPIVQFSRDSGSRRSRLFAGTTSLTLEGLEFRSPPPGPNDDPVAFDAGISLHVANCRFLLPQAMCFWSGNNTRRCVLRNCEILGSPCITALAGGVAPGGNWLVENCVQLRGYVLSYHPDHDSSLQLTRCTCVGSADWDFPIGLAETPKLEPGQTPKVVQLSVSRCVLDCKHVLGANPDKLQEWLKWSGGQNVYRVQGGPADRLLNTGMGDGPTDLAAWREFWHTPETGSLEGNVRYKGGNLIARLEKAPHDLTPNDFRLRPDSAGYRAGPDGKDLGADVDLVGPGPAYERWKKTPAYQEWLKETGQMK